MVSNMKLGIAMLLVTGFVSGFAQGADHLGKSCTEIVEMGLEKWLDHYWENKGRSEVDTNQAFGVFADCMKKRNEALLPELNPSDRERIEKYKPLFKEFREYAVQIQMLYAGGGTMFTHELARGPAYDEILFGQLIDINMKPVGWATAEKRQHIMDLYGWIRKELGESSTITLERRAELDKQGINWREILPLGSRAMRNLDKMSPLLPRDRQDECIAVFGFYWKWITAFKNIDN